MVDQVEFAFLTEPSQAEVVFATAEAASAAATTSHDVASGQIEDTLTLSKEALSASSPFVLQVSATPNGGGVGSQAKALAALTRLFPVPELLQQGLSPEEIAIDSGIPPEEVDLDLGSQHLDIAA